MGVDKVVADGLSLAEARRRLAEHGPNAIPEWPRPPLWRRMLTQLRDPMILLLLAATVLTVVTGDLASAVVIMLVVTVNTLVGVVQEARADRELAALRELSAPAARVVREGAERRVAATELVPGDVVVLAEGDVVPADGTVLEEAGLLVDESALTGESVPVAKAVTTDQEGALSAGTVVVRGRGRIRVTATGARSATGRIASLMEARPSLTPLQRRLAGLGRVLAVAALALCAVVLAIGLSRGEPLELMVVTAISLAVAAVPESLPAVVTLGLALGARRMSRRHAVVRGLPAVETLGSVTLIATDKTGTLTEGRMLAERLWTPEGGDARAIGGGFTPEGRVVRGDATVTASDAPDLAALLAAAAICNDASLRPPEPNEAPTAWHALGDPMEAALLAAAARLGLDRAALTRELPRRDEIPFSSERKRMTTVHERPDGGLRIVSKGAPEVVLVPPALADPPRRRAQAAAEAERLARDGYRVLAVAVADRAAQGPDPESGLTLLGLVGIVDPPREQARETIAACRTAGMTPVMVTGDHPLTARAVAARLGIDTGEPNPALSPVHARTTPEEKVSLVAAWRAAGHVVAMTGDGVNDGPALRRADIGVAMGRRGTEVARQAADLVLTDDDLATVVAAVEEGRRVYDNVRRFLLYGLAGGAAEILVMLLGPALGMALPLLPAQILWINLLTHGLPGVALGAEPADPDAMRRPPRPPREGVLGAGLWPRVLLMATFTATVTLAAGVWVRAHDGPWQSVMFLVLGGAQLGVALGSRARPGTLANPFLLVAVAAAFALNLAGVVLPPLRALLDTEPVSPAALAGACALSALGYVAMRLQDRVRTRRTG
ncbi:cation-translocating P-type ATPase [Streptomyces sp. 4N509B]|uniref:cation-translocating P-type ATPase n=1 Tax=Streptomyces sp. 4N509B TaxID=3457413 RepID=UPI003FD69393